MDQPSRRRAEHGQERLVVASLPRAAHCGLLMRPQLEPLTQHGPAVMRATWQLTAKDPDGEGVLMGQWTDCAVQADGVWGSGELVGEVSNTADVWVEALFLNYSDLTSAPPGAYFRPRLRHPSPETHVRVSLTGRRT